MDWDLLKKIDPKKLLIGEKSSPIDLLIGDKEKVKSSRDKLLTGIYYRKPAVRYDHSKGLNCKIEFFESQDNSSFDIGLLKTITLGTAERYFAEACKYLMKDKPQKSIAKLNDVLNKDPQYSDAYFLMGCILMEGMQFDRANSCFQKVLLCQKSLGKDLKKYLPSFHVTLNLNLPSTLCVFPELFGSTILVAVSYWENNKKEEALSALEQTEAIFPKNSSVLYLMTLFKLLSGKYKEIINHLSGFEPYNSIDLATYILVGIALYNSYDSSSAIQLFKNALKICERLEEEQQLKTIRYHMGKAYLKQGDKFEGLQELKRVASMDPDYIDIQLLLNDPSQAVKETPKLKEEKQKEEILSEKNIEKINTVINTPVTIVQENQSEECFQAEETKKIIFNTAKLVMQKTEEVFPLKLDGTTTIGRDNDNNIPFPEDFSISRHQTKIYFEENELWIEDLGSTNGTYLNKRRITKKTSLKHNDEIQMGKKIFNLIME